MRTRKIALWRCLNPANAEDGRTTFENSLPLRVYGERNDHQHAIPAAALWHPQLVGRPLHIRHVITIHDPFQTSWAEDRPDPCPEVASQHSSRLHRPMRLEPGDQIQGSSSWVRNRLVCRS